MFFIFRDGSLNSPISFILRNRVKIYIYVRLEVLKCSLTWQRRYFTVLKLQSWHGIPWAWIDCAKLHSCILYLWESGANTSCFHQQARYREKRIFVAKHGMVIRLWQQEKQVVSNLYEQFLGGLKIESSHTWFTNSPCATTWCVCFGGAIPRRRRNMNNHQGKVPCPNGFTGRF